MTKELHLTITLQADWQGALRVAGRDFKRVHDDVAVLVELGLLERTANGGLLCPFASMHIDMHRKAAA